VRGVFDSVADNYDLMNDLMSAGAIGSGSVSRWRWPICAPVSARSTSPAAPATSRPDSPPGGERGLIVLTDINAAMLRAAATD